MPYKRVEDRRRANERCRKLRLKNYPEKERAKHRKHNLKRDYGLSVEAYDQLLVSQQGVCAICLRPETTALGEKFVLFALTTITELNVFESFYVINAIGLSVFLMKNHYALKL